MRISKDTSGNEFPVTKRTNSSEKIKRPIEQMPNIDMPESKTFLKNSSAFARDSIKSDAVRGYTAPLKGDVSDITALTNRSAIAYCPTTWVLVKSPSRNVFVLVNNETEICEINT
jgi:hypothetical protein